VVITLKNRFAIVTTLVKVTKEVGVIKPLNASIFEATIGNAPAIRLNHTVLLLYQGFILSPFNQPQALLSFRREFISKNLSMLLGDY
jgi:hypothetical protein